MKKNEFKKIMKKENPAFKNYYVYEIVIILLSAIMVISNIILITKNMIPTNIMIINGILIIIIAIPIITLDIKNDLEIKKMYQYYIKENKIPVYKDKTKILNIILIAIIVVLIVNAIVTIPNISINEDLRKIENTLTIISNNGNKVETQYENLNGFKIKIPTSFKIMSDEMINIKYPNGNPPSLVYTNERGTINVALVMNDVSIKNSQIEEYIKTMESTYKEYSKDVELKIWERNNHTIGEIEFITQASDTAIYNHLIAFSVNDKLRLVNFNCIESLMSEWKDISKFIISSIIFEENK